MRKIAVVVCTREGFWCHANRGPTDNALPAPRFLNSAASFSRRIIIALSLVVVMTAGCTSLPKPAGMPIPVVTLAETPAVVRTTVLAVARERRIEKINRVGRLEGL